MGRRNLDREGMRMFDKERGNVEMFEGRGDVGRVVRVGSSEMVGKW